jgi:peptide-methionine (R)-S-oxide reductase
MNKKNLDHLSEEQRYVTQEKGTEAPFTGELLHNKESCTYQCVCCGADLFSSDTKFDSGTGWPSFSKEIAGAIGTRKDRKFFMIRTECHCSNCGSHLGHIFDDGPQPTGKRHCINGISLVFRKT